MTRKNNRQKSSDFSSAKIQGFWARIFSISVTCHKERPHLRTCGARAPYRSPVASVGRNLHRLRECGGRPTLYLSLSLSSIWLRELPVQIALRRRQRSEGDGFSSSSARKLERRSSVQRRTGFAGGCLGSSSVVAS